MKTLYIDCTNGISGDMLLEAFRRVSGLEISLPSVEKICHHHRDHNHDHDYHQDHHHHHGRSYEDVKKIIYEAGHQGVSEGAVDYALKIYEIIARAESSVHEMTMETVHFHEVGRNQAIQNVLGIGVVLDAMGFPGEGKIFTSPIYDGSGFIDCAHGRIPVPVPAVKAMMERCGAGTGPGHGFEFRTAEDVDTEMVTPSGLASLMGIGARPAEKEFTLAGKITAKTEVKGTRRTDRGGLRTYLIEE